MIGPCGGVESHVGLCSKKGGTFSPRGTKKWHTRPFSNLPFVFLAEQLNRLIYPYNKLI